MVSLERISVIIANRVVIASTKIPVGETYRDNFLKFIRNC